jgi:hypothetical protein
LVVLLLRLPLLRGEEEEEEGARRAPPLLLLLAAIIIIPFLDFLSWERVLHAGRIVLEF